MTIEEFVKKAWENEDAPFCPLDGIWCEFTSCINCPQMKRAYEIYQRANRIRRRDRLS